MSDPKTAHEAAPAPAHTPGPWIYYSGSNSIGGQTVKKYRSAAVCTLAGPRFRSASPHWAVRDRERTANAHLISAAPELLAALKEMRDALAVTFQWVAAMRDVDAFTDALKAGGVVDGIGVRAQAAIAKAEGRDA